MTKVSKVIHTLSSLSNLIFPEKCFGCKKPNTLLCPECGKILPYPVLKYKSEILAAVCYESNVVKKIIWNLKYKKIKRAAKPLAELIYERLGNKIYYGVRSSVIIPIPLSKKRQRQRGFNQAELIAKHLSDIINIPIAKNVLYKIKDTQSQVEIKDRTERLKNLKGVFVVKNPELVKNKKIYLVDDVSTTGTTINECRKTLKKAGAKEVIGLVVAG